MNEMQADIKLNSNNMIEVVLKPCNKESIKVLDRIGYRCKSGCYVAHPSILLVLATQIELKKCMYNVTIEPKLWEVLPQPLEEWQGQLNYKTTPWQHQERATRYILGNTGVFLHHSMGTGKSKSIIDAINTSQPLWTLIVAPLNVAKYTWHNEFLKHNNIQDISICNELGSKAKRIAAIEQLKEVQAKCKVLILNYESLKIAEVWELIQTIPFEFIILDESQKIKTPRSAISKRCHELGAHFANAHKVCATGTPISGCYIDLWSPYKFLNPMVFQPYISHFKACSFEVDEWGAVCDILPQHIPLMHQCRDVLMDTIKTEDVLNLPDTVHKDVIYSLTGETSKAYKLLQKELIVYVEQGAISVDNVLVKINALRQICSGHLPLNVGGGSIGHDKLNALNEELEQIGNIEPVVIFHTFKQECKDIKGICEAKQLTYSVLNGEVDQLGEWLEGKSQVLIVQLQAGGVGLDFTRARYCLYYSVNYNYTDYTQSLARVHRPGQTKQVVYVHFIGSNTIEEDIYAALETKQNIADLLLEKVKKNKAWDK